MSKCDHHFANVSLTNLLANKHGSLAFDCTVEITHEGRGKRRRGTSALHQYVVTVQVSVQ